MSSSRTNSTHGTNAALFTLILLLALFGGASLQASDMVFSEIPGLPRAGENGHQFVSADLDRDGKEDLAIVSDQTDTLDIFFKTDTDRYELSPLFYSVLHNVSRVKSADLNQDGWVDLAVGDSNGNQIKIFLNLRLDAFGEWAGFDERVASTAPHNLVDDFAIGDLNGDGWSDLVVRMRSNYKLIVLESRGVTEEPLSFEEPVVLDHAFTFTNSLEVADMDGDGLMDIVALINHMEYVGVWVIWNDGSSMAEKEQILAVEKPEGLVLADVNGDGRRDIVVASTEAPVQILLNEGNRAFLPAIPLEFWFGASDVSCGDFDGDGREDLVAVWIYDEVPLSIVLNTSHDGFFRAEDTRDYQTAGLGAGHVRARDIDQDGLSDLVVGHVLSHDVSVLMNVTDTESVDPDDATHFIRGDANGDGIFNGLVDGLFTLNFQFVPGTDVPPCFDAADADDDGVVNGLVDGFYMLRSQFVPGAPLPPQPFPAPGVDPTPDELPDCQ